MTALRLEGLRGQRELAAAARSSTYSLLAGAFVFPSAALVEAVASGRFLAELLSQASALPFDLPLDGEARAALALAPARGGSACGGGGGSASGGDPALAPDELQPEYIRLFEVGPGRPPCPLYEGSHRSGRMKIMEELVRFYEHFGLQPQPGDQPDHLCAELEFMHYLTFKEAAALSRRRRTAAFVLAQRDFLDRHLCRWLPRLRARLWGLEPPPFYRHLTGLTEELCRRDLAALRVGENPTPK